MQQFAVTQGAFDGPMAAAIEESAAAVDALVADRGPPFCDG